MRTFTRCAIETGSGEIIVPISESTGFDYGTTEIKSGYLLSFSSTGDTFAYNYYCGDTLFSFGNIIKAQDGYFITGTSKFPNQNNFNLLLWKLNVDKEVIWKKHIVDTSIFCPLITNLFLIDGYLYLCGGVDVNNTIENRPYLLKISQSGEIITKVTFSYYGTGQYNYMVTSDSSALWMFTPCCLEVFNGPSISKFDLDLNYLETDLFFQGPLERIHPTVFNSTIIFSSIVNRPGAIYEDNDIFMYRMDTSYNIMYSNHLGSQDTNDVTARFISIDFENQDSIFLAGYKNRIWGIPNQNSISWIIAGQLDSLFQPRYINYIGGDGYYETNYGIATTDGGHFICAAKFNLTTQLYDLFFLKLNNQGFLVNNKPTTLRISKSRISPNPASDILSVECYVPNSKIEIYTITGVLLIKQELNQGTTSINIRGLKNAVYLIKILYPNQTFETNKVIKL